MAGLLGRQALCNTTARHPCQPFTPQRSCRSSRSQVVRASKQQALEEMQQYKNSLSSNLGEKEQQWNEEERQKRSSQRWRLNAAANQATASTLEELDKDSFHPYLKDAGDTLVVIDFYTDWCGPCKVMLPLLQQMATELGDSVKVAKFNCNKDNKGLGKELGIKVAPTFHLYKKTNKVAELSGAKIDELRNLIDKHNR